MNRSIAGADGQQTATAVELAVNFILANLAFGDDGHVEIDVAVAGVQAYVGREFAWNFERNVAVASLQSPTCGQGGPGCRAHFDVSVARLELEFIEASVGADVAVAGRGVQFAVDPFQVLGAVAAVQIHLAFQSGDVDFAVAGPQVDAALTRHLNNDVDLMLAPFHVEVVVRVAHVDFNRIARLMFLDPDATFADLVARGDDLGFNRVLVPSRDTDIGVGGFDPQFRFPGHVVSLRPFVSVSGQNGKDAGSQDDKREALHRNKLHRILQRGTSSPSLLDVVTEDR